MDPRTDTSIEYQGEWVTSVKQNSHRALGELKLEEKERLDFEKNTRISLPRAVEISLGLRESSKSGLNEPKTIISPPVIVPLFSGMSFALPINRDENT